MWLVRCSFTSRRPRPRIHTRFIRGPSSAVARFTYRFSSVRLKLFSAFATADRTTRPIVTAELFGRCSRMAIASSADLPLMRSVTSRAFRGRRRWDWALGFTSMSSRSRLHGRRGLGGGGTPVPPERAGGGELAEPGADHRLGDEERHVAT